MTLLKKSATQDGNKGRDQTRTDGEIGNVDREQVLASIQKNKELPVRPRGRSRWHKLVLHIYVSQQIKEGMFTRRRHYAGRPRSDQAVNALGLTAMPDGALAGGLPRRTPVLCSNNPP